MRGAIFGDVAGSRYEFAAELPQGEEYDLYPPEANWTGDTLLTLAVYDGLRTADGNPTAAPQALVESILRWTSTVEPPLGEYGPGFRKWLDSEGHEPYGSCGNGAAARVSSVGWLFTTLPQVEEWAAITAAITHNHPEGIKGAQATAAAGYLARIGTSKAGIKEYLEQRFGYNLSRTWEEIRAGDTNGVLCQETVPEAFAAFLRGESFNDCLRQAISLGGDTNTRAAITGSIAGAFHGAPTAYWNSWRLGQLGGPLLEVLGDYESRTHAAHMAAAFAPLFDFLRSEPPPIEWRRTTGLPFPVYPEEMDELIDRMCDFPVGSVGDGSYLDIVEETGFHDPGNKLNAIANADVRQLDAMMTWHLRAERFCDGSHEHALKGGRFLAMARRAFELAGIPEPSAGVGAATGGDDDG
jgi:ADP-ribosylglycohydrolase